MAQAIGSSLYEEVMIGPDGAVSSPVFRTYRVPQMADIRPPRSTSQTPATISARSARSR
jgi:CO/xanthine dehydrogenase Mo-binding subunit